MKSEAVCCENCATPLQGKEKEVFFGLGDMPLKIYAAGLGVILYALALFYPLPKEAALLLYGISYLLIGGEIIGRALKNIFRGRVFDEYFLMSIATLGAFAIGEYPEAVAVMLFFQVGDFFHDLAVNRSRRSIKALIDIRPDFARLDRGEGEVKVPPGKVSVGDIILVKPGEKIPLDCRVVSGTSLVDTSALTGEPLPLEAGEGDVLLSGSVNLTGAFSARVIRDFGESTVNKILRLVQDAGSRKAATEKFITKFARYYTPAVVFLAISLALVPPLVIPGAQFSDWLYRALVFLVVSCPCALVVSIPLGFFGGIGAASRQGILIKGGNFLEALNRVDTVVFDKTGTLTKGVFQVSTVHPAEGFSREELLEYAALVETHSPHPIARSILDYFGKERAAGQGQVDSSEELTGFGVRAEAGGKVILAGSRKLMDQQGIDYRPLPGTGPEVTAAVAAAAAASRAEGEPEAPVTIVHVAVDGRYAGRITVSDQIKEDAPRGLQELRRMGVRRLVMLTGDSSAAAARQVVEEAGLDEVHAGLLPQDKVAKVEELIETQGKGSLVVVGDGINDAPVLARADIGVAMGGLGSDAAIEAADVVLMTDEPSKLAAAIRIARRTRAIIWQNIVFILGVKGVVLALGALGAASMWEAVFADVGVTLLAVLNVLRILRTGKSILPREQVKLYA